MVQILQDVYLTFMEKGLGVITLIVSVPPLDASGWRILLFLVSFLAYEH